jgi:hypothetical protein
MDTTGAFALNESTLRITHRSAVKGAFTALGIAEEDDPGRKAALRLCELCELPSAVALKCNVQ